MEHETKPWHPLVMVCPTCGASFCPEVLGLHVRLCPQCEAAKTAQERKCGTAWDRMNVVEEEQVYVR